MVINQFRHEFFKDATVGRLYVPGFSESKKVWVLEDAARPVGVKIPGHTCVPNIQYKYKITFSPKFGREMVQLYNVDKDLSIEHCGQRWEGVRVHGGNTDADTLGCPLVAYDRVFGEPKIFNSCEADLTAYLKKTAPTGLWVISNYFLTTAF